MEMMGLFMHAYGYGSLGHQERAKRQRQRLRCYIPSNAHELLCCGSHTQLPNPSALEDQNLAPFGLGLTRANLSGVETPSEGVRFSEE